MSESYTEQDIRKMQEEIEYRKLVVRKNTIEAVKEARAQGDLSENFEYYAAKKEKNRNESRIRYLERLVRDAHIIEDDSASDEVGLDTKVTIHFVEQDMTETYKIVTSIRGDSLRNYISVESPLGKALLHHKVGDVVEVTVSPEVSYSVEVQNIDKSEDETDDTIRSY